MHAALCVLRIYPGLRVGLRGVLLALGASAARYRQEIRGARTENALGDVEDRQLGVDAFLDAEYGCGTANHVPERVACGTTLTPPPLDRLAEFASGLPLPLMHNWCALASRTLRRLAACALLH